MRIAHLLALTLMGTVFSCAHGQHIELAAATPVPMLPSVVFDPLAGASRALLNWDIVQRTCALYVAVRSAALERPIPFGAGMDDSMVHWNKCPGGTMLACTTLPTANGDSVVTGIPWAAPPAPRH